MENRFSSASLTLSLLPTPPGECSATGAGVFCLEGRCLFVPLGKLMGKAGVMGVGGLAGSHSQAEMKHLLGSPQAPGWVSGRKE